ncbi:PAS domain S-box protein [Luteimonas sp. R10]|uniref:PAS domain S-box protein n=1 Tax=Luteimonas sp. R10 TaxID=3108176 RepID=UPI003088B725|nr:PAS domain-containing protein [Luteimonas sp. R10]
MSSTGTAACSDLPRIGEDRSQKASQWFDRDLLDAISAPVCLCDGDGTIVRSNRRAEQLLGPGPHVVEFRQRTGDPGAAAADDAGVGAASGIGTSLQGRRLTIANAQGLRRTVSADGELLRDGQGHIVGTMWHLHGSGQLQPEQFELEHGRLEDFFHNAAVALHLVAADGTILRANQAELDLLGYDARDYVGRSITEFHDDPDTIADILRRLGAGERLDKYPARLRARNGDIVHVQITSNALFRDGKLVHTRCFTVDVSEQHAIQQALQKQVAREHELLDALPVALYTTDADGRVAFFNRAAVEFSGRTPELGSDYWCVTARLYEPDGTPLPHHRCPMAVALKEGRDVRGAEALAERPDGTRVPFMAFPSQLRDASGTVVGAVNMLVDISERKRAESEQRALIDELNHRVKNALAAVQAIAAQTLRSTPEPASFAANFERRVVALGRAHDLLTRRRWTGLGIGELIDSELAAEIGCPGRIQLEGPEITLPPRMALSLRLALHELADNARRHGALSAPAGRIRLHWSQASSASSGTLWLQWNEVNGPPVRPPGKRGFGVRFIEHSASAELGGAARFDFDPTGVSCRIEAPMGEAVP